MTLPIHALAHITQYIRWCGPPSAYWTFPVERLCAEISRKSRSRKLVFKNLENECLRTELVGPDTIGMNLLTALDQDCALVGF